MTERRHTRSALALGGVLAVATGMATGVLLGLLADLVWLAFAFALLAGFAVGGALVFAESLAGARYGRALAVVVAVIAALAGQVAVQVFIDHDMRRTFAVDLARSRAADSGLDAAGLANSWDADPEAAVAFFARDADAVFEAEVTRIVGRGGPVGRLLLRSDEGLRLATAGRRVFGLPLGRAGAVLGWLAELALCVWLVERVRSRGKTA
jgi:hypothetical protein